jgi:hypothetical protein
MRITPILLIYVIRTIFPQSKKICFIIQYKLSTRIGTEKMGKMDFGYKFKLDKHSTLSFRTSDVSLILTQFYSILSMTG